MMKDYTHGLPIDSKAVQRVRLYRLLKILWIDVLRVFVAILAIFSILLIVTAGHPGLKSETCKDAPESAEKAAPEQRMRSPVALKSKSATYVYGKN